MLDLLPILFFLAMAWRIARAVLRESAIFREFGQPRSLATLVLLFPLGPVAYLAAVLRLGWVPALIVAAACYLPALIAARRCLRAFDSAGTDRVRAAREAATEAFGTAMGGLIYVAVMLGFSLLGSSAS